MATKETFDFELRLLDGLSAPTRGINSALKAFRKNLDDTRKAEKAFADQQLATKRAAAGVGLDKLGRARYLGGKGRMAYGFGGSNDRPRGGGGGGGRGGGPSVGGIPLRFDVPTAAGMAFEASTAIISAGASLAAAGAKWVVDTSLAKENLATGFEAILGDAQTAKDVMGKATKLAASTPFSEADVAGSIKQMLGAGFTTEEAFSNFAGLGDVAALQGFDPEKLRAMTKAITDIKGKDKLQAEELNTQLAENSGGMIGRKGVLAALVETTGRDEALLKKQLEKGKISADEGIRAIFKSLENGISQGKLGSVMEKTSKSVGGLLSTLQDFPRSLVPIASESAGMGMFRDALDSLVRATDKAQPRMAAALGGLVDTVGDVLFGGLGGDQGEDRFTNILDGISGGLEAFDAYLLEGSPGMEAFFFDLGAGVGQIVNAGEEIKAAMVDIFPDEMSGKTTADTFRSFVKDVADLARGLGTAASAMREVKSAFDWLNQNAADNDKKSRDSLLALVGGNDPTVNAYKDAAANDYMADLPPGIGFNDPDGAAPVGPAVSSGEDMMAGLAQGIRNGKALVLSALQEVGDASVSQTDAMFRIQSPSKLFAEKGGYVAEGFALGVERNAFRASDAMGALVAPSAADAVAAGLAGAPGGAGGGVRMGDVVINVTVAGGGDAAGGDALAEQIADAVSEQLIDTFERAALLAGAA